MTSQATHQDAAGMSAPSPLPPVHMERLSSWQSIPDNAIEESSSNKSMNAVTSAATNDVEAGAPRRSVSTIGASTIRRVGSGDPNYHNVGSWRAYFTMVKTQIGIGALALPTAYDKIGLIPGIVCLVLVAVIAAFSCFQIGQVKRRRPNVRTFEDLGQYLFGRAGREVFGAAYCLYFAFTTASVIQSLSGDFNALSNGGACTVWFNFLAVVIVSALASMRTLGKISWLSIVGVVSILASLLAVTIAVSLQDRPPTAPDGPWKSDYKLFVAEATALDVMSAMATFCFAYSGIMAYFLIQDEMKEPEHYNPAMFSAIATIAIVYIVASAVVYYYCGSYVASPALGSAGGDMNKVAYGLGLCGLIVIGVIVYHLTLKYPYFRITGENRKLPGRGHDMDIVLMRPEEAQPRTRTSCVGWKQRYRRAIWFSCSFTIALFAFVIANVIPYFDQLIALIGALLGTFMLCLPMAYYWLYDNWNVRQRNTVWWLTVCWCVFLMVFGMAFTVGGTYAASDSIWFAQHNETARKPWSCEDNSVNLKEL